MDAEWAVVFEAMGFTAVARHRSKNVLRYQQGDIDFILSFRHAYWNIAQMVAHHTINGCNLQAGDLLGTGTQSGPSPQEAGSLLEFSRGGRQPLQLPNGEQRSFLEDGDAIILRVYCERAGAARIGLGEVRGRVLPAQA
jgi:fumarylacetoacetase